VAGDRHRLRFARQRGRGRAPPAVSAFRKKPLSPRLIRGTAPPLRCAPWCKALRPALLRGGTGRGRGPHGPDRGACRRDAPRGRRAHAVVGTWSCSSAAPFIGTAVRWCAARPSRRARHVA
jgi:hypothetical protein